MRQSPLKVTADELQKTSPPLQAVDILRRNLLYAMFKGVSENDMGEIVSKQVEKAKGGDVKAAKLLVDMVQAGGANRSTVYMQQAVVGGEENEQATGIKYLSDYRWNLVQLLAASGGLTALEVARAMHMQLSEAALALDHDWFVKKDGRWHITPQADEDVLKPLAQAEQHRLNGATAKN